MKNLYFFILFVFTGTIAQAQYLDTNWTNQYDRVSLYRDSKITPLNNNEYLLIHGLNYIKLSTDGDSLSSGTFNSDLTELVTVTTHNNEILIAGNSMDGPAISKLDMNLDTIWNTTLFSSSFAQGVNAIYADGSDIYVSGSTQSSTLFITKLNNSGDTIWNTLLPQTTFSNLSSIIKLNDGNFLASGNLDDYPIAFKFNSSGDTIWSYTEYIFVSFSKMSAFERTNGEIVLIPSRKFITLDASGNKINESDFTLNHYFDIVEHGDTIYLLGNYRDSVYNANTYPIVEVRNRNLDSLGGFIDSTNIHPLVYNRFSDGFLTPSGGLVVSGIVRDSVNIIANTWNLYAAKFNDSPTNGIQLINNQLELTVFPNPTTGIVHIKLLEPILEIQIINSIGQLVKTQTGNTPSVSIAQFPKGFYTFMITTESGVSTKKVLKN